MTRFYDNRYASRPVRPVWSFVYSQTPGAVGNLVRGAGFPFGSDEVTAEHDGELGLSLGPFAGRHFPLLSDLAREQENELGRCLVTGEMASRPHGPSQLGVQSLDSIRNRYGIVGAEVLAAGEELAAYDATIRDRGAGSTKVWAGRCIR